MFINNIICLALEAILLQELELRTSQYIAKLSLKFNPITI
jgi:hypothetical protein